MSSAPTDLDTTSMKSSLLVRKLNLELNCKSIACEVVLAPAKNVNI